MPCPDRTAGADRSVLFATSFGVKVGSALAASTTYEWYYDVGA